MAGERILIVAPSWVGDAILSEPLLALLRDPYEDPIVDVLVHKSIAALEASGLARLVVAGGVGANARLRERLDAACARRGAQVHYPELALCTDNGAMIALAAAMRLQRGIADARRDYAFDVRPRWPLAAQSIS